MAEPIHVCIVTTAHPTDDVRVNNKFAHAFREAGFRVSWVGPGHAFFDQSNYNRDGIYFALAPPIRTRFDRFRAVGRIKRIADKIKNVNVYYAPDPDSAPLATKLARKNNAKVIFDIHEVYHGTLMDRWLMGLQLKPIREFVRKHISRICSRCDLVLGVSESVLAPYCPPKIRRLVVRSCAPSWFAEGYGDKMTDRVWSKFRFMHGKADLQRGTIMVMEALTLATRQTHNVEVLMLTPGDPKQDALSCQLSVMAREQDMEGALTLQRGVPMQAMPKVLQSCDAGMIAYGRGLGVDSLPNRLFEYMAAGIPVLAPQYSTEIVRIIEQEQCGLLVDFEDPASIASAMVYMANNPEICREMGARGREAFLLRHNWETEIQPVLAVIRGWFQEKELTNVQTIEN